MSILAASTGMFISADGGNLTLQGQVAIDTAGVLSSSVNISASAFYANGVELTAGGGGTPGGSDTQVQFNDGGSFGGDSGLVFNKTTDTLTIGGDLSVCAGTASIAHLSGCSPIQVHAPMQIQSLDEGGILFAGTSGSLNTDVDSLQWTTDREDNGGYLGLVVSSSASGSAALGDGMFMMTDENDADICLIDAEGAEFAVSLAVSDLDEGGILFAGTSGSLNTDVDSLQWGTDREDNDGYIALFVSSSASGSAALGDGIIMMTDAADEDICFITADGAEFAVDVNVDADLSGSGAVQGTTANFGGLNFEGNKVLTSNDGTIMFGATADQDLRANSLFLSSSLGIGVPAGAPPLSLNVHYTGSGNPSNLSNDTGGGEVVYFGTSSAPLTAGMLYYLNTDGGWASSSAGAQNFGSPAMLGISLGTDPSSNGMLTRGYFNVTSGLDTFQTGSILYMSTTSGSMTTTSPSGSGQVVRLLGHCAGTPNVVYFNPDLGWIEIA